MPAQEAAGPVVQPIDADPIREDPLGPRVAWIVLLASGLIGAGMLADGKNPGATVFFVSCASTALSWLVIRSAILSALRQHRREQQG